LSGPPTVFAAWIIACNRACTASSRATVVVGAQGTFARPRKRIGSNAWRSSDGAMILSRSATAVAECDFRGVD
jgi:hypothetical protein